LPFITAVDWHPGKRLDSLSLYDRLKPPPEQLDLFAV